MPPAHRENATDRKDRRGDAEERAQGYRDEDRGVAQARADLAEGRINLSGLDHLSVEAFQEFDDHLDGIERSMRRWGGVGAFLSGEEAPNVPDFQDVIRSADTAPEEDDNFGKMVTKDVFRAFQQNFVEFERLSEAGVQAPNRVQTIADIAEQNGVEPDVVLQDIEGRLATIEAMNTFSEDISVWTFKKLNEMQKDEPEELEKIFNEDGTINAEQLDEVFDYINAEEAERFAAAWDTLRDQGAAIREAEQAAEQENAPQDNAPEEIAPEDIVPEDGAAADDDVIGDAEIRANVAPTAAGDNVEFHEPVAGAENIAPMGRCFAGAVTPGQHDAPKTAPQPGQPAVAAADANDAQELATTGASAGAFTA